MEIGFKKFSHDSKLELRIGLFTKKITHVLIKIEVMLLSEFGFTFGSNFTSAVRSAFRNLFEFSVRNTKAMGSDRKLLAS